MTGRSMSPLTQLNITSVPPCSGRCMPLSDHKVASAVPADWLPRGHRPDQRSNGSMLIIQVGIVAAVLPQPRRRYRAPGTLPGRRCATGWTPAPGSGRSATGLVAVLAKGMTDPLIAPNVDGGTSHSPSCCGCPDRINFMLAQTGRCRRGQSPSGAVHLPLRCVPVPGPGLLRIKRINAPVMLVSSPARPSAYPVAHCPGYPGGPAR